MNILTHNYNIDGLMQKFQVLICLKLFRKHLFYLFYINRFLEFHSRLNSRKRYHRASQYCITTSRKTI